LPSVKATDFFNLVKVYKEVSASSTLENLIDTNQVSVDEKSGFIKFFV
jgi:hypothetical protein